MVASDFSKQLHKLRIERNWSFADVSEHSTDVVGINGNCPLSEELLIKLEAEHPKLAAKSCQLETLISVYNLEYEAATNLLESHDKELLSLLPTVPYPFVVFTPLADLVAFNSYFPLVYGLNELDPDFSRLKNGLLGTNILRLYFDESYEFEKICGSYDQWKQETLKSLEAFNVLSKNYKHTIRYNQIVETLSDEYEEFKILWDEVVNGKTASGGILVNPFIQLYPPLLKGRPLTFAKLSLLQEYLESRFYFFGHIPVPESLSDYQQIQDMVQDNTIYFFKVSYSLDEEDDLLVVSGEDEVYTSLVKEKQGSLNYGVDDSKYYEDNLDSDIDTDFQLSQDYVQDVKATRKKVDEILKTFPAEIPKGKFQAITFAPENEVLGLTAVYRAGTVRGTVDEGVIKVPEQTLKVLEQLSIPFQAVKRT